jgi:glycosyltransferase involved in cell wall biosynthesis
MNQPLVSIILPVFNTEKYVAQAIQSVLDQSYKNLEIICINDGSSDNSLEIVKSFGDKIIIVDLEKNSGIAAARNEGIKIAHGDYLAFMDSDDLWTPNKIELQMNEFEKNPQLQISFTYFNCFLSPDLSDEIKNTHYCPPDPAPGYISATAVVKTEFFKLVGMFDPKWRVGEFIDWYSRAQSMNATTSIIPEICLLRRIHGTNTGVTQRDSRLDYVRIAREALARKREQSSN